MKGKDKGSLVTNSQEESRIYINNSNVLYIFKAKTKGFDCFPHNEMTVVCRDGCLH